MPTISAKSYTAPTSAKMGGAVTTSRTASACAFAVTPGRPGTKTAGRLELQALAQAFDAPSPGGAVEITTGTSSSKPLGLSPLTRPQVLYMGVSSWLSVDRGRAPGGAPGGAPGAAAFLNKRKRPKIGTPGAFRLLNNANDESLVRFRLLSKKKNLKLTTTERTK